MRYFSRSQFNADLGGEKAVQRFFYMHARSIPVFRNLKESDSGADREGVDFTLVSPDIFGDPLEHWGDFKVALDYRKHGQEQGLSTFAFEILGVDGKNPSDGWLFGEKYKADFYCIQWIWMKLKDKCRGNFSPSDIERLEYCVIPKDYVINRVGQFNINKSNFRQCAQKVKEFSASPPTAPEGEYMPLRSGEKLLVKNNKNSTKVFLDSQPSSRYPLCLHLSKNKLERPINILINKRELIENSLAHGVFDSRISMQVSPDLKYKRL